MQGFSKLGLALSAGVLLAAGLPAQAQSQTLSPVEISDIVSAQDTVSAGGAAYILETGRYLQSNA
ncbi:MAG: hypothetical protein GDA47_01915 [Rhodospirillales bacterium]|nr:hypothetical protein [Rhodospirillales bacterium]